MPDPTVLYDKRDGVAWITLNRPAVLNALDLEMRDALWAALDAAEADPEVGVVVFRGAVSPSPSGRGARGEGIGAFSSGADVSEFGTAPSFDAARRARLERDLWGRLAAFEKPLVAAIHGYALGAGCELALLCDLRLASDDARLGLPEVNLGYIPTAGGSQTLPRTIGRGRALDMILTGEAIPAHQALDWVLLHWAGPRDQLYAQAEAYARRLLARPQGALRLAKRALVQGLDLPLAEGLRLEARLRSLPTA